MSNGILALSVYKPSDGTTYQLDGANIAPDSLGYVAETNLSDTSKGTERKRNQTHTLEIRHNDSTFHSNLTGDSDYPNKSWRLAIAELDGFVLWEVTTTVNATMEEGKADPETDPWIYTVRMKAVVSSGIARGRNLIYAYNKANGFASSWQDSDSSNIADGFDVLAGDSGTFVANVQQLTASGSFRGVNATIVLPITGLNLTLSFSFTDLGTDTEMNLRSRNFAGSTLSESITNVSSTGIDSSDLTTPSNTYNLLVQPLRIGTSGGDNVCAGSYPAVYLNGGLTTGTEAQDG